MGHSHRQGNRNSAYMNDGGTDLAPRTVPVGPGLAIGIEAEAVRLLGITSNVDHR